MDGLSGSRRDQMVKVGRNRIERELRDFNLGRYERDMQYRSAVDTLHVFLNRYPSGEFSIKREKLVEAFGEDKTKILTYGDS